VIAGAGNDNVYSKDGAADTVNCGPGKDTAVVDKLDKLVGCEQVIGAKNPPKKKPPPKKKSPKPKPPGP
jgi:hypothetical protein